MKLLLLQGMALAARLVEDKMCGMLQSEYKVILTALDRSGQLAVPLLKTYQSVVLFADRPETKRAIAECKRLDLSRMDLKRLPVYVLQQMVCLEELILDENRALEIAEDEIGVIRHLPISTLSISSSDISGMTLRSILQLPNLTSLDVSENTEMSQHAQGSGFGELGDKLVSLNVSKCHLDGRWLSSIFRCTKLVNLNISWNSILFSEVRPSDSNSFRLLKGRLESLQASWCSLTDEWVGDMLECTNLAVLDISNNIAIGQNTRNFTKFRNLRSLVSLNVCGTNLCPASLESVCRRRGLLSLDISSNEELGSGVLDFGGCAKSLEVLNISYTMACEGTLRAICGHQKLRPGALMFLNFPKTPEGFARLRVLDLSGNSALGSVMSMKDFSFGKVGRTLTALNVADTEILNTRAINAIGQCAQLQELNISCNPCLWRCASDTVDFGCLQSGLKVLNSNYTGLSPEVLDMILRFNRLEVLDISFNSKACLELGISSQASECTSKAPLKMLVAKFAGLTVDGERWILDTFKGLVWMDVQRDRDMTPVAIVESSLI